MKRFLKRLCEIAFTAFERVFYSIAVGSMGGLSYMFFASIATTTGWLTVARFFLGLLTAAATLAAFLCVGLATPFKFKPKKKKVEEKPQVDYSEYDIYLNG